MAARDPISPHDSSESRNMKPEVEKARTSSNDNESTLSSSSSSVFSERHMEGPPSLRSQSLSRTTSRRLETVQSTAESTFARIRSRVPRQAFSHPLIHEKTREDVVVEFDGPDDPYRPINWPFKKKVTTTLLYGFTTMGSTLASSIFSPGTQQVAREFGVGREVATLGTALLLFGFGIGPLVWAPLSEVYGRKPAVLIPVFISSIFAFGGGAAKDIQTIIICRFFQGLFGSAPVTNTGGVLGDIWSAGQRGAAIVGYALAVVGGPTLGESRHEPT